VSGGRNTPEKGDIMRVTSGGCYEIDGAALRRVSDVSPGPAAADSWRDRQADLWRESSALIHVNHRLSDEELGLWGAMQQELDWISRTLNAIERAALRSKPRH
jgi:hypothetical protein